MNNEELSALKLTPQGVVSAGAPAPHAGMTVEQIQVVCADKRLEDHALLVLLVIDALIRSGQPVTDASIRAVLGRHRGKAYVESAAQLIRSTYLKL